MTGNLCGTICMQKMGETKELGQKITFTKIEYCTQLTKSSIKIHSAWSLIILNRLLGLYQYYMIFSLKKSFSIYLHSG